jgi:hypothetical protein
MFNLTLSELAPTSVQVITERGRRRRICRRRGKREGDGRGGTARGYSKRQREKKKRT